MCCDFSSIALLNKRCSFNNICKILKMQQKYSTEHLVVHILYVCQPSIKIHNHSTRLIALKIPSFQLLACNRFYQKVKFNVIIPNITHKNNDILINNVWNAIIKSYKIIKPETRKFYWQWTKYQFNATFPVLAPHTPPPSTHPLPKDIN